MQALAVRVHRADRCEAVQPQVPHRLGHAQFEQVDPFNPLDAFGVILRRAADRVEIHRPLFLEASERLFAHATFANHRPQTELFDDVRLERLFPHRGRRPRPGTEPLAVHLVHDGTTVVDDSPIEIDRRIVMQQVMMQGIPARVDQSIDHNNIARANPADLLFGDRRLEHDFATGQIEPFTGGELLDFVLFAIQPTLDLAGLRIEYHPQAAERPAVVRDGDEE